MNKLSVLTIAAVVLLSADSATADLGLPSAPTLPPVPTVTPPKVLDPVISATPSLPQVPSVPSVPSVPDTSRPQTPSLPNVTGGSNLPSVSTRSPSASHGGGSAPGSGSSSGGSRATSTGGSDATSTGGSGATSAGGSGGGTSAGARGGAAAGTPAARRRAGVRQARRERRLRKTVDRLQGCLGGLSRLERRVLVLRAGLGAGPPRARSRVARRLDLSTRRVTRLEHRGVRKLRGLARGGRCGTAVSVGGQTAWGAVADGSPMATAVQGIKGLFGAGGTAERTQVKAERESSDDARPDDGARGTSGQRVMAPPRVRVLGLDLTLPLLVAIGLAALVFAVRSVRRGHGPSLP